ncbi:MAG: twin transmembrane helix small protein [Gammaproteobacteria bacterium]|nr:twin transmembrane helix small protein [Gammaproteobacteria bacterium]MDH3766915.1 twin transmembrane helix small protein [Gammaproteobacteria bacterium]
MYLLTVIIVLATIATIATLVMGLVSMARGGDYDLKHSEHLMYTRVGIQGGAVLLMLIALFLLA